MVRCNLLFNKWDLNLAIEEVDLHHKSYWRNGNRPRDNILSIGDNLLRFNYNFLYSRGAQSHLDNLKTHTCCSTFQPLLHHGNAAIIEFVCSLLAGHGQGNLQGFCHIFCGTDDIHRRSSRLHSWDRADHQTLLARVIFRHFTDLGAFGKFQLFIFGIHFLQIYF